MPAGESRVSRKPGRSNSENVSKISEGAGGAKPSAVVSPESREGTAGQGATSGGRHEDAAIGKDTLPAKDDTQVIQAVRLIVRSLLRGFNQRSFREIAEDVQGSGVPNDQFLDAVRVLEASGEVERLTVPGGYAMRLTTKGFEFAAAISGSIFEELRAQKPAVASMPNGSMLPTLIGLFAQLAGAENLRPIYAKVHQQSGIAAVRAMHAEIQGCPVPDSWKRVSGIIMATRETVELSAVEDAKRIARVAENKAAGLQCEKCKSFDVTKEVLESGMVKIACRPCKHAVEA